MHKDERLVGFEARKLGLDFRSYWDALRCQTYLLKNDVSRVLSTDTWVWPSVFSSNNCIGVTLSPAEAAAYAGLDYPDFWIGPNDACWSNLEELKAYLDGYSDTIYHPYGLIAVTCVASSDHHDWKSCFPYADEFKPGTVHASWQFLGYDVSDAMLSGLTNCGNTESEAIEVYRSKWGALLNDNHLFDFFKDADSFRVFTDTRVPEHAPFLVYGLYLIEEIGV